jgi:hypothetical protein
MLQNAGNADLENQDLIQATIGATGSWFAITRSGGLPLATKTG